MGLRAWASLLTGAFLAALTLVATPALAAPVKVTCAGSSSMAGTGSSAGHHISDELAKALGPDFTVENFAVAATTAIKSVPNAWASTTQMSDALASNPDVVLFWFGGNDSWADVWTAHSGEFKADYTSLVQAFQALPSHPKTVLIRLWVFKDGPAQLSVLDQEILPMIDMIGAETNSAVIDYRSFMEPHPEWFPDGMHANDTGTAAIGPFFAEQLLAVLKASPPAGGGAGGSGGASGSGSSGSSGSASVAGGVAQGGASNPASTGGLADAGGGVGTAGASGSDSGPAGSGSSASSAMVSSNESSCSQGGAPRNGSALWLLSALALLVVLKSRLA